MTLGHSYYHVIDPLPGQDLPFYLGTARVRRGYRSDRGPVPPGYGGVMALLRGTARTVDVVGATHDLDAGGIFRFDTDRPGARLEALDDGAILVLLFHGAASRAILAALIARHGCAGATDPAHPVLRAGQRACAGSGERSLGGAAAQSLVAAWLGMAWPEPAADAGLQAAVLAGLARREPFADAARRLGISREHLSRRLRRELGRAPRRWLADERLRRAGMLLGDGGLAIDAVAAAVGYASPTAFSASFRRAYGLPPGVWRRSHS